MSNLLIETNGLNFAFKKNSPIINDLNLQVAQGSIYGLLGPNGAGKTTTIRLLLGLLTPQKGRVNVFGGSTKNTSVDFYSKVGTLIETPSLYLHLTGWDNLNITRKIKMVPKKRIAEVLEIVKLSNSAKKKVKNYSTGMKQRLGIAIALLSEPQLLVLDEPTNGLDPKGITDVRELLFSLNHDLGITILISSHILSEIEKLVSHLGIIHGGELKYQGTIQGLENIYEKKSLILVETNDTTKAAAILRNEYQIKKSENDTLEIAFENKEQINDICKKLISEGIAIYDLHVDKYSLEKIFLEITKN